MSKKITMNDVIRAYRGAGVPADAAESIAKFGLKRGLRIYNDGEVEPEEQPINKKSRTYQLLERASTLCAS